MASQLILLTVLTAVLIQSSAALEEQSSTVDCFTDTLTELSKCKSPEVVSLVNSHSNNFEHKRGHFLFKLALYKFGCDVLTDSTSTIDCEYQVEISGNDPVTRISILVLQVLDSDNGQATSRFVQKRDTTDTGGDKQRRVSCSQPDDTMIVKFPSTPEQTLTATLLSTAVNSFRYFIVDSNHVLHVNTVKPNQQQFTISYKHQKTQVRRKRALTDDPSAQLLIANGDYLHLSSLDGSRVYTPVLVNHSDDNILAIDYNYRQRFIYWTDNTGGRIFRSNLDGSMITPILEQGLNEPDGIAVDWVTNKVYFTDTGLEIVGVFDVENNWYKVLLSTLDGTSVSQPRAIVVDPSTGWMYWTDWGATAKIERASMDGSNRTVLHNTGLTWPNGLTIDYTRQVLYWVDAFVDVLESSSVNGANRMTIAGRSNGLAHPFGVSFYNDVIFSSDWNGNKVQSITINGDTTTLISTCTIPYGVVVMSEQRQAELTNPCSNSSCSHLCLLSAVDPRGYTCECPEGYTQTPDQLNCNQLANAMNYSPSPKGSCRKAGYTTCCINGDCLGVPDTCFCDANCHLFGDCCQDVPADCLNTEPSPYMVYTSENYIYRMSFPTSSTSAQARQRTVLSGQSRANDIDFHFSAGHLYWTDTVEGKIWRSNFDGTGMLMILDTGTSQPVGLAIDWVTNKLYWINGTDNTINVIDLANGNQGTVLVAGLTASDLFLDPIRREMYWTLSSEIAKSSMDGGGLSTAIVSFSTSLSRSLFIDFSLQAVFWTATADTIVRANFDGTGRTTVYSGSELPTAPGLSNTPLSMVMNEGALYYVGMFVGVAATNGTSSARVLNYNLGCTDGNDIKIISSSRQPQANNPCAVGNGGCPSSEICVLSSTAAEGVSCISTDTVLPISPSPGTCAAAEITECCESGSCMGNPPTCSCASNCQLFHDCCSDAPSCDTEPTSIVSTISTVLPLTLEFLSTLQSISVNEFEPTTFQCRVNIPAAQITWLFLAQGDSSGEEKQLSSQEEGYSIQTSSGSSTLTVSPARFPQHLGQYTCRASYNSDSISTSAQLDILVSPMATIVGLPSSPSELDNIAIRCNVRGNPSPEISWLKSSSSEVTQILSSSRITIESVVGAQQTTVSTLQISRVTAPDSGLYVCQADNGLTPSPARDQWCMNISVVDTCLLTQPCLNGGACINSESDYICVCVGNYQGVNCETQVSVPVAPAITQHPSTTVLNLASSVNLTCTASGSPTPSYTWYKDGELVEGENRFYLYIPEVQPEHRGEYTCRARNVEGEAISDPAFISVPRVLQYSTKVQLSGSLNNLTEVTLSLVSSELSTTETSVFSVNISNTTQTGNSIEVTLLITLLPQQEDPSPEQIARIREALTSRLTRAPTIFSTETLVRIDGCNAEEYQGVIWPETRLGSSASGPCPCLNLIGESAGRGIRVCEGTFSQGAVWSNEVDLSSCFTSRSEVSQQLCDLALLLGSSTNATIQVSQDVVDITSQFQNLTSDDVSTAAVVVEQLALDAATNPLVTYNYLQTIDNIQQADDEVILESRMNSNSSIRILGSLETFLDNLNLTTVNQSADQATLSFSTFAVQIQQIDPDDFSGQTFIVNLGSVEQAMNSSGNINQDALVTVNEDNSRRRRLAQGDTQNSTAFLQLSPSILNECANSEGASNVSQRISYSVFVSTVLFLPENVSLNAVGSIVLAARLRCELANKTGLSVPIKSSFQTTEPEGANGSSCAVYTTEGRFGAWDTSGCRKIERSDGRIDCECSQLGHFGILFDLNPDPLQKEFAIALSAITYVGLGISLVCLGVLILTDLISKKLRSNVHNQVLINMAISLSGLYILFLIGGFTTNVPPLCGVVSALLHYFFLVFFAWTAVEAVWLYLKLVTVLGNSQSITSRYVLKAGLPSWLTPAMIVVISGGAGHKYYTSPFYCRPTGWPFYFGYILPFLVVYIFNWVIFILIMASICKHMRSMSELKKKTAVESLQDTKKNFIIAMSLAVVLGLGWGFGLAATSSDIKELTFTLQVIFSLFVGSQGLLIFILHGARNAEFREFWLKLFRIKKYRITSKYTVSNTEKGHMTLHKTGRGSGTDTLALSSQSSAPEKLDLSAIARDSTSGAFTGETIINSHAQSPTDSVFSSENEMCSELVHDEKPLHMKQNKCYENVQSSTLPDVRPSDMKPNECYQTIQTGGSAMKPFMNTPRYEEVIPVKTCSEGQGD